MKEFEMWNEGIVLRGRIWGLFLVSPSQWEGTGLVQLSQKWFWGRAGSQHGGDAALGWRFCCQILRFQQKKKTQLKEQTPNWELRLHGETIPRKKSVTGMDAFTNRQKYLFHSIFKVFKPHDLSFSGADSSAIVTLSESWACQEKSGDRTRPLLVTLEALQLQGLCWGHLSRRIYFG